MRPNALRLVVPVLSVVALAAAAAALSPRAADAAPPEPKAFVQNEPRAMSRVVFFGAKGLAGEYSVQYGKPQWRAEYDAQFEKMTRGKRLRLGKDWWTTLETFSPLVFGGKTEVAAGSWFLALECSATGDWSLVVLDPAPLRKDQVDAFSTAGTKGGTLVPLAYDTTEDKVDDLSIRFVADEAKPAEQTLEIRFGKHRLTTSVAAKL